MSDSFVTQWTVAHQAPLSWDFPGKNTGVGCPFLLQGIFLTQGLNLRLLHWQVNSVTREAHQKCVARTKQSIYSALTTGTMVPSELHGTKFIFAISFSILFVE